MVWRASDPQGHESDKVKYVIPRYTRGRGLDLGCGPKKAYPHFIGVDSQKDTQLFGIPMKPDHTCDVVDGLDWVAPGSMDFVFSSHTLEHIEDHEKALKVWWSLIKPGGHLVLYLPHRDLYPRIGTPGSNPDHKHDFHPDDIIAAMRRVGSWDLLENESRDQGMEYSFLQVYKKRTDGKQRLCYKHKPEKSVCVVRFGGYGDMLQAANIFPELKRQGYHVTVMTTAKGQDVLRHDPHIDDWIIQDQDQVPNPELTAYWEEQAKRFTRFINLSESVEGSLLAIPGRAQHAWPHGVRDKLLNVNYLEFTAMLAELPITMDSRFYETEEERDQAKARIPDGAFVILWTLAGSSVHKTYPHQDGVIAEIMLKIPEAVVMLVGDASCKLLEQGWENEKRVIRLSGEISIRETLALAKQAHVVIGPETGVLNAVAFEANHKVVFLSHSSRENLTKHWYNVTALSAEGVPCYPCHRLHYGAKYCTLESQSMTAICQFGIDPGDAFLAVQRSYDDWKALSFMRAAE